MSNEFMKGAGGFVARLKGRAMQVAGAVIGNEELKHEGELHERKADAITDATRLDTEAQQERARGNVS